MSDAAMLDLTTFRDLQETAGVDFVKELIKAFQEEAPGMLAELRMAFTSSDPVRFKRAAHSLKSNSQAFGAMLLAQQARALELGGLPADVTSLGSLEALYACTLAALQEAAHGAAL